MIRNIFLMTICITLSVHIFGSPVQTPDISPIKLDTSISPIISPNTLKTIDLEIRESKMIRRRLEFKNLTLSAAARPHIPSNMHHDETDEISTEIRNIQKLLVLQEAAGDIIKTLDKSTDTSDLSDVLYLYNDKITNWSLPDGSKSILDNDSTLEEVYTDNTPKVFSLFNLNGHANHIQLDSSGEQNKFVNAVALNLYAYDNSNNVIDNDYIFDSQQDNMFMQELKQVTPNSNAAEFKNNIDLLDKERAEEMLSRILDHAKERDSAIVQVALHQILTDINKVSMNAIHNRLLNTGPSPAIASAGDEDVGGCNDSVYRYGMWARSSINHSKDKVSNKNAEYFSSYKTKGHSSTIGFDSLICNNILLGIAYTNAYTSIRLQNQNIGNIDKVRTNMFLLYSAYNIPNYDWYLNSTVSYAESSIRGKAIRNLAVAKNVLGSRIASSKYKSYLYSGSVSLGYNHHINNNIYITPSLGAIGSLIRDKGYTENGTSFQNLTVHSKNYNKLSGIAGLRAYQDIYLDNIDSIIVTPEAYGFINYNIKNKTSAIEAKLQGIDDRLPTINYRNNRVDYNLGLGITVKQNMMEYGINYDASLAKKYQGHSGSIKVIVNL